MPPDAAGTAAGAVAQAALEAINLAHRGRRDRIAERIRQCVDRAPAGAMGGGNRLQLEGAQRGYGLGNDAFVAAREMKAAEHAVKRLVYETVPGVRHYIDDAGVGTSRKDRDAPSTNDGGDEPLVENQRIGLETAAPEAVMSREARLVRGHPVDSAAGEEEALEKGMLRRLPDHIPAGSLELIETRLLR